MDNIEEKTVSENDRKKEYIKEKYIKANTGSRR